MARALIYWLAVQALYTSYVCGLAAGRVAALLLAQLAGWVFTCDLVSGVLALGHGMLAAAVGPLQHSVTPLIRGYWT